MSVELSKMLVELISYYQWNQIFYVYNYENAVTKIESIINSNVQTEILVRKIKNLNQSSDVLRLTFISAIVKILFYSFFGRSIQRIFNSRNNFNTKFPMVVIVDLDSRDSYLEFLLQVKKIGMTNLGNHFIFATLVRISLF